MDERVPHIHHRGWYVHRYKMTDIWMPCFEHMYFHTTNISTHSHLYPITNVCSMYCSSHCSFSSVVVTIIVLVIWGLVLFYRYYILLSLLVSEMTNQPIILTSMNMDSFFMRTMVVLRRLQDSKTFVCGCKI